MRKEFKSPIKLPQGGETQRCFYPFKLDTYGCGCSHNCLYCYAKATLNFRNLWDSDNARVADFDKIKKEFEKGKNDLINQKMPVRLGGMTDCFANDEQNLKITEKVINYLNSIDYPYLILTKNKLVADYADILNKDNCIVQFTITTEFDDLAAIFEEGASSTTERCEAGKKLADLGFYTTARINPLFPMRADGYYSRTSFIKDDREFKYFTFNLPQILADHDFKTIIGGFLRLSSWNIRWIKEKTGEDLTWLFDKQKRRNGALHFSEPEIKYYYENIKKVCDKNNVDFSVCYDGDANYEVFKYLWANPDDCCNNFGKVKGFTNKFDFYSDTFIK